VVDLRTGRELQASGRGPLGPEPVAFHHLAVVQEGAPGTAGDGESVAAPAPPGDDLAERYLWYLEVGRGALVEALTLLGGADHYPLVFHCAAGKDRTGVLAALVLELVGVDRGVIVPDYVTAAERIRLLLDGWRADPGFAERMARVPPSRFGVEADTMEGFLDGLAARHGGARSWALGAGVPADALDRLVDLVLEPGD
jgi:protein-tyrosine phosphatase